MDTYLALVYLTEANEQRNAWAELQRALKYFNGHGLPRDEDAARRALDRIHRTGKAMSAFCLAFMHEHGMSVEQDDALAARHYDQAATLFAAESVRGVVTSTNNLGFMYAEGKGVARDLARAAECFAAAAAADQPAGQLNMGLCHLNGWGVPQDDAKAFDMFARAAENGNAAACGCLAHMIRHGLGSESDPKMTVAYLQMGADRGDPDCWYELGCAYEVGFGVRQSVTEAARWLELAAADGDARAQARLAALLLRADPTRENVEIALRLLEQAGDQGDHTAAYVRGSLLAFGNAHVDVDVETAHALADKLVDEGSYLGHRLRGEMHEHGCGVPRDQAEAATAFLAAATRGDWVSQVEIGRRYLDGNGVTRDDVEALAWFSLASGIAGANVNEEIAWLERRLSMPQLKRARSLANTRRVRFVVKREFQIGRG